MRVACSLQLRRQLRRQTGIVCTGCLLTCCAALCCLYLLPGEHAGRA